MSRAALKKELSGMSADQLVEVILDAYKARSEIKEYFEYFINPDVEKLYDKYVRIITREFNKSKRHKSKARVSVVNNAMKDFASFSPGADWQVKLFIHALTVMGETECSVQFADSHWNLVDKLVRQAIEIADQADMIDKVIVGLSRLISVKHDYATRTFKRAVSDSITKYKTKET